jgi:hypothetical protein
METESKQSETANQSNEVYAAFCVVLPSADMDDLAMTILHELQILVARYTSRGVKLTYNVASSTAIPVPEITNG